MKLNAVFWPKRAPNPKESPLRLSNIAFHSTRISGLVDGEEKLRLFGRKILMDDFVSGTRWRR